MSDVNVVKLDMGKADWMNWWFRRQPVVLIVEDDPSDIIRLSECAKDAGFAVVSAQTAEQALGILHSNGRKFALVLVDVGLPRMDGWVFFRIARENWPALRVWMMSGSAESLLAMPHGAPVTVLLKAADYHETFRELRRQI